MNRTQSDLGPITQTFWWSSYDNHNYILLTMHMAMSLKQECLHFDEIFITGCTGSCQNDNFQSSQWWKFRQNDDIFVSVMSSSGPVSKTIFHHNSNSMESYFQCNSIVQYDHMAAKCRTCHDSTDVALCTKFHSDRFIKTWKRAELIVHRIWITMEKIVREMMGPRFQFCTYRTLEQPGYVIRALPCFDHRHHRYTPLIDVCDLIICWNKKIHILRKFCLWLANFRATSDEHFIKMIFSLQR